MTVPSGLTSHVLASEPSSLPEPSSRTRPSYRLSRRMVAIEAVASAVGSSDVGSWMMPMIALGLLETADDGGGGRGRRGGGSRRRPTAAALGEGAADGQPTATATLGDG